MAKRKKASGPGCLGLILSGLVALVLFVCLRAILGLGMMSAMVLAVIISNGFTSALLGKQSLRQRLAHYALLLAAMWVMSLGLDTMIGLLRVSPDNIPFDGEESVESGYIVESGDSITVLASNRVWRDNFGNSYKASFVVREDDYLDNEDLYRDYPIPGRADFWGSLYLFLAEHDRPSLDLLVREFGEMGSQLGLTPMEFAEMVVTGIQDIPYSLVFQDDCLPPQAYEASIAKILVDCPQCCIGQVPYGIQSPVSFVGNLKGDCDTRTVLLFTLLRAFGYDVAILNSDYYRHSILGLNLPASGLHKFHNGKRYYAWETTAKYFKIGDLPPLVSDMDQWEVVLTSK